MPDLWRLRSDHRPMIGWREAVADRARVDCRQGVRAKSQSMSGSAWKVYIHAWRRESLRMGGTGKLPQTELFKLEPPWTHHLSDGLPNRRKRKNLLRERARSS